LADHVGEIQVYETVGGIVIVSDVYTDGEGLNVVLKAETDNEIALLRLASGGVSAYDFDEDESTLLTVLSIAALGGKEE
jgi:hypothetical protein